MLRMFVITIALMATACSDAASNCTKEDTLKLIGAGYTKAEISDICGQAENRGQLTDKKSSVAEGKLMDWNGEPVVGMKIIAQQVNPIKGYQKFEAITKSDGSFHIEGLYPSSQYRIYPWSDKWESGTKPETQQIESAPQGEIALIPSTITIEYAYSKESGNLLADLATGEHRFRGNGDGGLIDSQTGLNWWSGPNADTGIKKAKQWIAHINTITGGGWRMPTYQELKSLYHKGVGEHNMDPALLMTGRRVWMERHGSSSAWDFDFNRGVGWWNYSNRSQRRAFAVRRAPSTDTPRFSVSDDGVISDSQTGLDWMVGPDQDTDYNSAEQWVASISDFDGGNWRMPTRHELKNLYLGGVGERNMDLAFKTTGGLVWAEPYDSSSAWGFNFERRDEHGSSRDLSHSLRVFGVRSR